MLDVRPAEEYRAGHIPGALSIPIQELKRRLSELPKSRRLWPTAVGLTVCFLTKL